MFNYLKSIHPYFSIVNGKINCMHIYINFLLLISIVKYIKSVHTNIHYRNTVSYIYITYRQMPAMSSIHFINIAFWNLNI